MPKFKYVQRTMSLKSVIPFTNAEEAWFWYVRSERERRLGRPSQGREAQTTRPCDPDDIYRIVMKLRYKKLLMDTHLRVLAKFGWRETPPDPRLEEETRQMEIWDEAFRHIKTVLIEKGIINYG